MRVRRTLVLLAATVASALALAAPAVAGPAGPPPGGVVLSGPPTVTTNFTHVNAIPNLERHEGVWWVKVSIGYDYNPASNHLAAYTKITTNDSRIHLQTEPLRLGDLNGVLKDKYVNVQNGFLEADTDVVACHKPDGYYTSRVYLSVRWPNGVLLPGLKTEIIYGDASVVCV